MVDSPLARFLTCMQWITQIHSVVGNLLSIAVEPLFDPCTCTHLPALVGIRTRDQLCGRVCTLTFWATSGSAYFLHRSKSRLINQEHFIPFLTTIFALFVHNFYGNVSHQAVYEVTNSFIARSGILLHCRLFNRSIRVFRPQPYSGNIVLKV